MATPLSEQGSVYLMGLLLAESAAFREAVHAADADAALRHVYWPEAEADEGPSRAIVTDDAMLTGDGIRWVKSSPHQWKLQGSLLVSFDFYVPGEESARVRDAWAWFSRQTGRIVQDIRALAGRGESVPGKAHLNVQDIALVSGPFELDAAELQIPDPQAFQEGCPIWHASYLMGYW